MNPNKTTILRFKPIAEITDEERKKEVLCCDGNAFIKGFYSKTTNRCDNGKDTLFEIKLYAVLPKDE